MEEHRNSRYESIMAKIAALSLFLIFVSFSTAATSSPLISRGYTVLPTPQKVELGVKDFEFTGAWRLELGQGVKHDDIAVQSLSEQLQERFQLALSSSNAKLGVLRLAIVPKTVTIGAATDSNQAALAKQAYRMTLAGDQVTITGNSSTGLFYGVQTFVQLLKRQNGKLWLPEGHIDDWPDLELRIIYWDDAHHLEHLDVLKAALKQASFYKINGFSIKLEGHFQYQHAAPVVEPYALSPAQFQELTDYGLKYHVQLIPYLDAPAHDAFILKHPEYAGLREYPDNNYEFCVTNPKTDELFRGMYEDLLAANKGGKYIILSTDEAYYVGLANNEQCREAERAKELGSVGKLLAEFVTKTASYLHDQGRTVIFWGEFPMKPDDIGSLPNFLINGELYGPKFDPVFRAHGIRQLIYTSTVGEEQLFPRYYPGPLGQGRLREMFEHASLTSLDSLSSTRPDSARPNDADVMGIFLAGWADPGANPETFWLGYAAGTAPTWNSNVGNPKELEVSFYQLFYGPQAANMGKLYRLMSEQADFWDESWQTGASAARSPIWGNSFGQFNPPKPAHDQYLSPLPVPTPEFLRISSHWRRDNQKILDSAGKFLAENDQLLDLLEMNMERVQFNRYNLEVCLSVAGLFRQNLLMLLDLGRISDALEAAEFAAAKSDAEKALAALDRALSIAEEIRQSRNRALQDATSTWYKSWYPRVAEANGRTYLDSVDDVKDHPPVRTVDMKYLVYRELRYPLGDWARSVIAIRNAYARERDLPVRSDTFDWSDTSSAVRTARAPSDEN
jgi:hexosaminidase